MEVLGLRHIKTCRKAPLQVNFLDDDILHCLVMSVIFLRVTQSDIEQTSPGAAQAYIALLF
jgi:hypothetical protein